MIRRSHVFGLALLALSAAPCSADIYRYIDDHGILDIAAMRPIARCGYTADYTVLDRLFQMERPR